MDKHIQQLVDIVADKDTILMLLQLPEFTPSQFLYFWNWYQQKEEDALPKKDKLERFIDIYLMFPYCDTMKDWFGSHLTPAQIQQYRSLGVDLNDAMEMVNDDSRAIDTDKE